MTSYDNLRAIIAQNIRYLRKSHRQHQRKVASRCWLSRMENGHSVYHIGPLMRVAESIGVSPACFFVPDAGDPFLAEVTHALPHLNPQQRRILLEVLQDLDWKRRQAA